MVIAIHGIRHYKFKEFEMKKAFFLSICLLGSGSCFAQDFSILSAFRDTIKNSIDEKTYTLCDVEKYDQLHKIGNECLYSLSLSLDSAIDKRYKELQIKNKKNKLVEKFPLSYFSKLRKTYSAYEDEACFNPLNDITGGLKNSYDAKELVCNVEQKLFHIKTLENFDKNI